MPFANTEGYWITAPLSGEDAMSLDAPTRTVPAIVIVPILFLVSSPGTELRAQTGPAVGTRVVIKGGASLKVGEQVVDTGASHRVYQVEKTNGDWRWLVSGKTAGWARSADVIPLTEAIDYYKLEIERNPHAAWPYYNLGLIYQDHGKNDEALASYSAALRQDPAFVPALINRGNIWMAKKTPGGAIEDYAKAIKADPKSILAHVNRGIAYQTKKDFDKALEDYDEAIRLGLKTATAFNNRGHVREIKRDYDLAIADYDEAIRLEPNYYLAWINRGSARQARGEYEQALADYTEATRLNPASPWGYARQAWIRATCPQEKLRNGKEAVALATEAAEKDGARDASVVDIRAAAHAEDGDYANAIFWEKQAIVLAAKSTNVDAKNDGKLYRARLALYEQKRPYREAK